MSSSITHYLLPQKRTQIFAELRYNLKEKIQSVLYPQQYIWKIKKLVSSVLADLRTSFSFEVVKKADRIIQRYGNKRSIKEIMQTFDRQVRPYRTQRDYKQNDNLTLERKWLKAHQPIEILHRFPQFAQFLESSKLLSQIKVTKDTLRVLDNEPAMLVEGEWTRSSSILARFSIADSEEYGERFVIDSSNSVYTYLDNGKGLQKFHPFLSVGSQAISTIQDDELKKLHDSAEKFIRTNEEPLTEQERADLNAKRPFTLQVVTSYTDLGSSNLNQTMRNPRHSYLRIIAGENIDALHIKKGQVWEFGFGWKKRFALPMISSQGRFRTPDVWEYMPADQRYVTNIPVTAEEASRVFQYTIAFHRRSAELGREIGFHMAKQNCTVFVREAVKQAGIKIPTEATLPEIIRRITPDLFKKIGHQILIWTTNSSRWIGRIISKCTGPRISHYMHLAIQKIAQVFQKIIEYFTAFILSPIRAALGDFSGDGGDAFNPDMGKVEPTLKNIRNFFDLSSYRFNMPCVLQDWQKKQSSTVIYNHPVRLTIVPT